MHPHISEMANTLFYNGKLVDNACTVGRSDANLFSRWIRSIGYEGSRQSIFCEVSQPELYVEVDGHSKLNPAYLTVVLDVVQMMLAFGIPTHKIAIITFYSAQRACYEKILNSKDARWSGLKLMSVDASQGDEAPFVLLDPSDTWWDGL